MSTYGQVCQKGHIMNHSTNTEFIRGENKYCTDCGSKGITQCPECETQKIKVSKEVLSSDDDVLRSNLPIYCGNCGEEFPWVGESENLNRRNGEFVPIETAETTFYSKIIKELNRTYKIGANTSALVLVRKCIENALVDILRNEYGVENNDIFYDTDKSRTRSLSELVDEFDDRLDDFESYSAFTGQDIITKINELKQKGNIEAHSIRAYQTQEEMDEYSEKSEWVLRNLLKLKRETDNSSQKNL